MTSLQSTGPRHARPVAPLRIAMVGTRGVSARGSDDEVVVGEVAQRLVRRGHRVTVYGSRERSATEADHGLRRIAVPALTSPRFEALSRTALSTAHLAAAPRQDVVFVFGSANAPLVPVMRGRGTSVALHVGGLEWKRAGRSRLGRRWLRRSEELAVREADALVSGSRAIADYFEDEFGASTDIIRDGCRVVTGVPTDAIERLGLVPGGFLLTVADLEPDDHLDTIIEGFHRSASALPLIIICAGRSRMPADAIDLAARRDERIVLLGAVQDERLLDQLFAHAAAYLYGRSLGNTGLSLLRAMGAGTAVVCWDVVFNREVGGTAGFYFSSPAELTRCIDDVERYPARYRDIGEHMQERAQQSHDWDSVAEAYEMLAARLARGHSAHGRSSGRRARPGAPVEPVGIEVARG